MLLGVGSILCSSPQEVLAAPQFEAERTFIRQFLSRCQLVTARDRDTFSLLAALNPGEHLRVRQSFCPSLWGNKYLGVSREPQSTKDIQVTISFSTESAEWAEDPERAVELRKRALRELLRALRELGHRVCLVAHNDLDARIQREVARAEGLEAVRAHSAAKLLDVLKTSHLHFGWRVHGALAALSLGVPTVLFKSDSRYHMAQDAGALVMDDTEMTYARAVGLVSAALEPGSDGRRARRDFETALASEQRTLIEELRDLELIIGSVRP